MRAGLGGGGTTDSLDPGRLIDGWNITSSFVFRNTLVEILPNLRPGPELAVSWEPSSDVQVWTFELRRGVEFHNGKTFDAEDVIFSINYHRHPDSTSGAKGFVKAIQDIKAEGPNRVIFTLEAPNADFPLLLSEYRMPIVAVGTTDFNAGNGTGAYILESFEPGVVTRGRRNPNYWRDDRGFFDEVELLNLNDTSARTNALLSGQVDVINRVDLRTVELLKQNPSINVQNEAGFKQFVLPMLCDVPPFDNVDVRIALKHAIDRDEMVEKVLYGFGRVGNDIGLTPSHRFFNDKLEQRTYDPDKARHHLKKAGAEGHTFNIHAAAAGFDGAVDAAVLYQAQAAKAGIKMNVVREPIDGYYTNVWRKKPFCTSYTSSRVSEDAVFSLVQGNNEMHWSNPRWEELLSAARGELDDDRRREMYHEMQQIEWDEAGKVVPFWINFVNAHSSKIKAPEVTGINHELDGYRFVERWWSDEA